MTTPVDIVNSALDEIRARATITSFQDGSAAANLASRQYQNRIDSLSRAANWNCLRYQASLSVLKAVQGSPENPNGTTLPIPPVPWAYEYEWPSNPVCLKPRFIVPVPPVTTVNPPLTTGGGITTPVYLPNVAVPFVASSDLDSSGNQIRVLLTNLSQAQLVYTARVDNPDLWDSQFIDAAIFTLAAWFCEPITGNKELGIKCAQMAKDIIAHARITDGNEGPTTADHTPDWISARYQIGPSGWGGAYSMGYDSMSFPGSVVY